MDQTGQTNVCFIDRRLKQTDLEAFSEYTRYNDIGA